MSDLCRDCGELERFEEACGCRFTVACAWCGRKPIFLKGWGGYSCGNKGRFNEFSCPGWRGDFETAKEWNDFQLVRWAERDALL